MNAEIRYYSATGITQKIVKAFAQGLNCDVHFIDLTRPENRQQAPAMNGDLEVIAAPVYGERIPRFILQSLRQIHGNGKPLVTFSIYGNVSYGISLAQFARYARENHFQWIGAGTFVGEHSYARAACPVAYGRPDAADLQQARQFGEQIRQKLEAGNLSPICAPAPGLPEFITNFPDRGICFLVKQPAADAGACNRCGACVKGCPVKAIDLRTLQIDEKKCLRCYACVKGCPRAARKAEFRVKLFETVFSFMGRRRKENQMIW